MLKKFLIGTFVAAAFMVVGLSQASADCSITTTLKVGSTGAEVSCLQTKVGATSDGSFGPMTKASVMAYQASHGLSADGVVGPLSRAVLNGSPAVVTTTGCPAGALFNSMTGASCTVVTSSVAGCAAGALFSATTGASCVGGTVVVTGPLVGGAGNISSLTKLSVYNDEELNEGATDKVLAFEVKADSGSDLALTSLKIKFLHALNGGSGSYRMDNYMNTVNVYMGSTKVGTLSVANFTKNTADNSYSGSVSLAGVTVKAGQKVTLAVEVTANNTIDSTDQHSAGLDWTVSTVSLRYNDATGAILTDSTVISETIAFSSVVNSGDLALKLSSGAGNPTTGVVVLSETGTTTVPMLAFTLKASGGDMDVTKLEFQAVSVGDTDGTLEMVSDWELFKGTTSIATFTAADSTADDANNQNGTVVFSDISGLTLVKDVPTLFTVKAKVKAIAITSGAAIFDQGDSLKLSFTNAALVDVTKVLAETTSGGDTILTGDRTGAVTGNVQTFWSKGMSATFVSATGTKQTSPDTAALTDSYTGVINFDITAIGEDVYIDKSALFDTTIASVPTGAGQGIVYYIAKSGAIVDQAVANYATGPTSILTADGATTDDSTTDFVVKEGATRRFHLTATLSLDTTGTDGDGYYQIKVASINWDPADATAAKFYTINLTDFISPVSSAAISDYAL